MLVIPNGTYLPVIKETYRLLVILVFCGDFHNNIENGLRILSKRKIKGVSVYSFFVNLRLFVLKVVYIGIIFDVNHCNFDNYSLSLQWI